MKNKNLINNTLIKESYYKLTKNNNQLLKSIISKLSEKIRDLSLAEKKEWFDNASEAEIMYNRTMFADDAFNDARKPKDFQGSNYKKLLELKSTLEAYIKLSKTISNYNLGPTNRDSEDVSLLFNCGAVELVNRRKYDNETRIFSISQKNYNKWLEKMGFNNIAYERQYFEQNLNIEVKIR